MRKFIGVLFGLGILALSSIPLRSEGQVVAYGYYTVSEACPDSGGTQSRCRPDGPDWCQVSRQTTCPEFEGFG
jgi:hypothetical protein